MFLLVALRYNYRFFSCSGVKIQRLQKSQVHMDLDFKWDGDGDIVLNIGVMGTKLPVQVLQNQSKYI